MAQRWGPYALHVVKRQAITKVKPKPVMVDLGATHGFVDMLEARRLGLALEDDAGPIKFVNSKACPIYGVAYSISVEIRAWRGTRSLS